MTYIEPDSPAGQPEIMPPDTPGPDIDPASTPQEAPQQEPGVDNPEIPAPMSETDDQPL